MAEIKKRLYNLIGESTINSSESLIVAVCQASLLSKGLEGLVSDSKRWEPPVLPQKHSYARLHYNPSEGISNNIQLTWVAMPGKVIMSVYVSYSDDESDMATTIFPVKDLIRPDASFPVSLSNNSIGEFKASIEKYITDDAISSVSRTIDSEIIPKIQASSNHTISVHRDNIVGSHPTQYNKSTDEGADYCDISDIMERSHAGNRMQVGDADLNPLGSARGPSIGSGGGMIVGPDHPMFRRGDEDISSNIGPEGYPQELPPGAVPPGARFDPIGPFGQIPGPPRPPGVTPQRGHRPGAGSQGPGGFFSGDPDPSIGRPPNSSWNYFM